MNREYKRREPKVRMLKSLRIFNLIARNTLTAWLGTAAWIGLGAASSASAADAPKMMPVKAAPASSHDDWSGFYVGGHFGYGGGGFGSGTNPALGQGVIFPPTITGLVGGFQAGYNWQLRNNVVLGI
jgi:high affinity Mn2+ porin